MKKLCVFATVLITALSQFAQADEAAPAGNPPPAPAGEKQVQPPPPGEKGHRGMRRGDGPGRRGPGMHMNQEDFKKFDKDGDGKLSPEERTAMMEERRQRWEKRFDKDGDGKLNAEERAAMEKEREDFRQRMQQHRQEMMKKYDKDGDGKLSPEEREAMRKDRPMKGGKHGKRGEFAPPPAEKK